MHIILRLKSILHRSCQTLAVGTVGGMIKEYIRLMSLAAAIHMQEDGTAIGVVLAVFSIKFIDFDTSLTKASHLVQRDSVSHTSFALTIIKVAVVTNAVFGILNNDINLCPLFHQITGKT